MPDIKKWIRLSKKYKINIFKRWDGYDIYDTNTGRCLTHKERPKTLGAVEKFLKEKHKFYVSVLQKEKESLKREIKRRKKERHK